MRLFTSYFPNQRKLLQHNVLPVSIALYPPMWWNGAAFPGLAPVPEYLDLYQRRRITQNQFAMAYASTTLASFREPHMLVMDLLNTFGYDTDIALVCHEQPGVFCHRHLAADFMALAGTVVVEWTEGATAPVSDNPLFRRRVTK